MSRRRVLVIGALQGNDQSVIQASCQEAGFIADFRERVDDGITSLRKLSPEVVLIELETAGAERFCRFLRTSDKYGALPSIALSRKINDLAFASALRWGLDDIVPSDSAQTLVTRLNGIPEGVAAKVEPQGQAVIADRDNARAGVLARLFRGAGYQTVFAQSEAELRAHIEREDSRLFVLASEFGTSPGLLAARPRSAMWVIVARPRETGQLAEQFAGESNLTVVNGYGNPENVLYASNELGASDNDGERLERRTVYGTVCDFRSAGDERDETGFTYNVSANGIYLRSLAIPRTERLWLELRPPRGPRRVRLLAEIIWRRGLRDPGPHTAPPGCGLRIIDGLADDLSDWRRHVSMLAEQHSDSVLAHRSQLGLPTSARGPVSIPRPAPILSVGSSKSPPPAPTSKEIDEVLAPLEQGATEFDAQPIEASKVSSVGEPIANELATDERADRTEKPPAAQEPIAKNRSEGESVVAGPETQPDESASGTQPETPPVRAPRPAKDTGQAPSAAKGPPTLPNPEAKLLEKPSGGVHLEEPTEGSLVVPGVPKRKKGKSGRLLVAGGVVLSMLIGAVLGLRRVPTEAASQPTAGSDDATSNSDLAPTSAPPTATPTSEQPAEQENVEPSPPDTQQVDPTEPPEAAPAPSALPSTDAEDESGAGEVQQEDSPVQGAAGAAQGDQAAGAQTAEDVDDAQSLPPEFGYLFVRSSLDTKVFVHGQFAGLTNQRLKIRCGPKFVRLGEALGQWQTEGRMAHLKCRNTTTLEINE